MRRLVYLALTIAMLFSFSASLGASRSMTKGQEWLDARTDPAAAYVNGNWYAREWGTISLIQAKDSREVTGSGDGWNITGVVSGKKVYLLFSSRGAVVYSAILTSMGESELDGSYQRGLMKEEGKGKRMHMTK